MFNILVVEDDKNARKLYGAVLEQNGFRAVLTANAYEAFEKLDHCFIDLIVLDVMLPDMDGFAFAKELRDAGWQTPILMATARETITDKRRGFSIGCDDYMVKPVDEEELILRIRALLRRSQIANEHRIVLNHTVFDYDGLTVTVDGQTKILPQKEFMLIYILLSYQNKIFTRRALMDEIWDMDSETDERTVDVHINRLREKFKNNPDFEIVTVRGLGYKAVIK
ncbi:MAG: response regulator transcription factor [Clostridia bacterium]|nr:response regulator transcription factor [Clostridia bacterium]